MHWGRIVPPRAAATPGVNARQSIARGAAEFNPIPSRSKGANVDFAQD
jgi:hypothetical protein